MVSIQLSSAIFQGGDRTEELTIAAGLAEYRYQFFAARYWAEVCFEDEESVMILLVIGCRRKENRIGSKKD